MIEPNVTRPGDEELRARFQELRGQTRSPSFAAVLERAAAEAGVDMPIVSAVCALLAGRASVGEVVERLLARPLRPEAA